VQQDDSSRLAQLRCHTARQGHIYRKFTWGNRKSLVALPAEQGVDVRERLVQYYRCWHPFKEFIFSGTVRIYPVKQCACAPIAALCW
jgi:hypothetical protein